MKNLSTIREAAKKYALRDGYHDELYVDEEAFTVGAISPEAKEYHTEGLYTESEVEELSKLAFGLGIHLRSGDVNTGYNQHKFYEWFEKNKKK